MTDSDRETVEDKHCQNCKHLTTLYKTTAPDDTVFWVCETCIEFVEDGGARCVFHDRRVGGSDD